MNLRLNLQMIGGSGIIGAVLVGLAVISPAFSQIQNQPDDGQWVMAEELRQHTI